MFALDLRSLALFRILLGLCLFIDLSYRLPFVYDFYSDHGVLPRDVLISKFMNIWETSLFLLSGQTVMITVLMLVAIVSSLALMVGFYTRVAAFICWLIVISMHTRNGVVLHGGDDVFRVMLFWFQFAPVSACFSVDALRSSHKVSSYNYWSWGTMGLLLQLLYIYLFTGILKWHPVWHTEGSGVYYALHLEQFSSSWGQALLPYYEFMQFMSFATLALELAGPVLVILPFWAGRWRLIAAASFMAFHLGLVLTMHLGMFPWLCIAAWTMVFPSRWWETRWGQYLTPILSGGIQQASQVFSKMGGSQRRGIATVAHYPGRLLGCIAMIFVALITTWNIYEIDDLQLTKPVALRWVMSVSEMYQRWSMFAPYPRKDDGWYVIEAEMFNGKTFDPFQRDHKLNFEKPQDMAVTYQNSMWRKYLTNSWLKTYYDHRLYFGRYLCRKWNTRQESQDTKINTILIHYMLEMTPSPGALDPKVTKETIWRHYCYEKPKGWID